MFTNESKRWLVGLTLGLMLGAALSQAADHPEVLYEADPVAQYIAGAKHGPEGRMLARAGVPDSVAAGVAIPAGVALPDEPTSGSEQIKMRFKDSEHDIMTREALEKLNVVVESLQFSNADLHNVIRIIGERLNINFIFDAEDISGKVTLRLHNIRLRDALDSILSTRKLAIIADRSGIFRIVPQEVVGRKRVETKTEVLQLNWINAADVIKTMKPFLSDEVGKMEFNQESNSLIITDVPPQIEVIRGLINQLDIPERQVLLEARLADVNVGAIRALGTKWSATAINQNAVTKVKSSTLTAGDNTLYGGTNATNGAIETVTETDYLGSAILGTSTNTGLPGIGALPIKPLATAGGLVPVLLNGFTMDKGQGQLSFGQKLGIFGTDYDINAVFTALENRKVVQVLANPRVTTLNNVPAKISILETIPYIQASGMTSSGTQVPTIEFKSAGVDIEAKPIITPNGYVRMEVKLKQMIFVERVGSGSLDPPVIDERNAETNVIVQNNKTVVLGGLRQLRQLEQMDGLPWVNRIPLIGWLFKNKNYDDSKMELVLMMTPRIIQDKVVLSEREKYWYDRIDNSWHIPDYFFDETKSPLDDKHPEKH